MFHKKLLYLFLVSAMLITVLLSSCGQQNVAGETTTAPADVTVSDTTANDGTDGTTTPQSPETTEPSTEIPETEPPKTEPSDITPSSLTKQSLKATDGSELSYWLYTSVNATENMPLLIYLHGGSGKGDDLDILMQNGFPKFLKDGLLGEIPAYIVIPQVSTGMKGWTDIKNSVRDLVYYCCKTYGTDSNRVSLTGHSMGGTGTWNLALAFPDMFSCIAPMSGSITVSEANLNALSGIPVWAFVGSADTIVKPESSINFIGTLKNVNTKAQITVFDGADHFSIPELAYLDKEIDIIGWLITNSKCNI